MAFNQSFQLHYDDSSYFHLIGGGSGNVTQDYYWDCRKRTGSYCMLQYTLAGEGLLQIGTSTHNLKTGDTFLATIPGNQIYSLTPDSSNWQFIYLEFSTHFLDKWLSTIENMPIFSLKNHPSIVQDILQLNDKGIQNNFSDYFENASYSSQFFFNLLRLNELKNEIQQDNCATWLSDYHNWLDINYAKDISLDDAADYFKKSKYTLIKAFKQHYHQSPKQYLIDIRIKHATRLLIEQPELPIATVSKQCGFQSANYFTKVFHKKTTYSPRNFVTENTLHKNSVHYFNH